MKTQLLRRLTSVAVVAGLGGVLPLATGAAPAHAAPLLSLTVSHTGDFARGAGGSYHYEIFNSGTDPTSGPLTLTDTLPAGLEVSSTFSHVSWECDLGDNAITCTNDTVVNPGESYPFLTLYVAVAEDAPCTVTNSATISGGGNPVVTANDVTYIRGGECDPGGGGGEGGAPLLPITLDGVVPLFNNISTTNNVNSPNTVSQTVQDFAVTTP